MRTFTIHEIDGTKHVYNGIGQDFIDKPETVAVIQSEDVIEVWALDAPEYISELRRYFEETGFPYRVVGIYEQI